MKTSKKEGWNVRNEVKKIRWKNVRKEGRKEGRKGGKKKGMNEGRKEVRIGRDGSNERKDRKQL